MGTGKEVIKQRVSQALPRNQKDRQQPRAQAHRTTWSSRVSVLTPGSRLGQAPGLAAEPPGLCPSAYWDQGSSRKGKGCPSFMEASMPGANRATGVGQ